MMGKNLRPLALAEAGPLGRPGCVLESSRSGFKRCGFYSQLLHFILGQIVGPGCISRAMPGYNRHSMHIVE